MTIAEHSILDVEDLIVDVACLALRISASQKTTVLVRR